MTQAITSTDTSRNNLLMIAAGGLLSGILTPLTPQLIDRIVGGPGDFRIALVAVPFAVLVFYCGPALQRQSAVGGAGRCYRDHGRLRLRGECRDLYRRADHGAAKIMRNMLAGLAGGFVGAGMMALGIALLPAGPRDAVVWMRMLIDGHAGRRAAGGRQRARPRPDLGALSGLAGRGCGAAGDGAAVLTAKPCVAS